MTQKILGKVICKSCSPKGFTLIELLVVILIVSILAAVALPQYQVAVQKVKITKGIACTNSLIQALQLYRLSTGEWPPEGTNISSLAEIDSDSFYYVNRRNTATETVVVMCGGIQTFIQKGGNEIIRHCRAHNANNVANQACKNMTGKDTGTANGDFVLYAFD